jgi:asparagine synthase (glutamine-hydrolysing)
MAVPPGYILTVDVRSSHRRLSCYWDWKFPQASIHSERSASDLAEELRALLIDSVRLQLRSDVPVGAYLSGGLDSSVITALIRHYTDSPLRTFSITFEDSEFDESHFQHALVRHLGTQHSIVTCRRTDIGEAFPRTIWHTETPILRTAPTPLMLLSAKVREEGYKVVLTGEGADEVFGGYDLFKEARVRRFWARHPDSVLRPLILTRLYPYLKNSPTAAPVYAQRFFRQGLEEAGVPYFGHLPRWSTTRRNWRFFSTDLLDRLRDWDPIAAISQTLPPEIQHWDSLCQDQYIEARTLMSEYLLCSQGDRMAMANSVEGRFPYLDHRVIEFANRLPARYKLMGLKEKYLLKRSIGELLPESILNRPKQPYRAPDSQSFFKAGEPLEYIAYLLCPGRIREAGYFDATAVTKLFDKCRQGKAIGFVDNMAFVGILSTMLLDELFVRSPVAASPFATGLTTHIGPSQLS